MITAKKLYQLAQNTIYPISLKADACAGQVACALEMANEEFLYRNMCRYAMFFRTLC